MTKTQAVTKTQHPDFSFATVNVTKRGAHLETDWFDVPATDVFSNNGLLAFGELMQVIADKQPRNGLVSRNVIEAAARATGAPVLAGKSQRWAAMHFMNILCDALVFFEKHANWQAYLALQLDQNKKACERYALEQKERMAELTRRSIAARKAKKAAKDSETEPCLTRWGTGGTLRDK